MPTTAPMDNNMQKNPTSSIGPEDTLQTSGVDRTAINRAQKTGMPKKVFLSIAQNTT
jgi:hypothetical protein